MFCHLHPAIFQTCHSLKPSQSPSDNENDHLFKNNRFRIASSSSHFVCEGPRYSEARGHEIVTGSIPRLIVDALNQQAIASRIWSRASVERLVQGKTRFFTSCTPQEIGILRCIIWIPWLSSRDRQLIYIFCSSQILPNHPQEVGVLAEHLCI